MRLTLLLAFCLGAMLYALANDLSDNKRDILVPVKISELDNFSEKEIDLRKELILLNLNINISNLCALSDLLGDNLLVYRKIEYKFLLCKFNLFLKELSDKSPPLSDSIIS